MKAYVTSIGEKTTKICCEQLKRYGFEVVLLDRVEPWIDKYKRFIKMAEQDGKQCLRIDADIVPNKNISVLEAAIEVEEAEMWQYRTYDFYKNNISIGCPVIYTVNALKIIRKNQVRIDRPETSASRLYGIKLITANLIVGMHGFFQNKETMERAIENKIARGQMHLYDFKLANKLNELL